MGKEIGIGLLGYGTVGAAVAQMVQDHGFRIATETGTLPLIRVAGVRDTSRHRDPMPPVLTSNLLEVVEAPEVDVVIEVMGGMNPAGALIRKALQLGKPVITANKMLMAEQWADLMEFGGELHFEAAVAGAIPIVETLSTLVATQPITRIEAILNGTTNYILTQMRHAGKTYDEALAEAQALGYAEAEPSSDVEGWDAAYKLVILASMIEGDARLVGEVDRDGITLVSQENIQKASAAGRTIKLVAQYERGDLTVGPVALESDHPLASVDGVENALVIEGPALGRLMLRGAGAGGLATATSVLSDLIRVIRRRSEQ